MKLPLPLESSKAGETGSSYLVGPAGNQRQVKTPNYNLLRSILLLPVSASFTRNARAGELKIVIG